MITVRTDVCGYCGVCVSVCPRDAIELGNMDLKIDSQRCDDCRVCLKVCPLKALEASEDEKRV